MNQLLVLTAFAESLHQQIWEANEDELRVREESLAAELADLGLTLPLVLHELPDESLALAIQKKFLVRESFTALFVSRYGPYLARWLFRWGTESHQALDVIQELYVRFYERRLVSYDASQNFRAYLHRSAYNLWVQKVHRPRRHVSFDENSGEPSTEPGPVLSLLAQELSERIDQAIEQLRPRERNVLKEIMAGKSAAQVALDLDLRKEQVFMSLFRARRRMEQLLELPQLPQSNRDSSPSLRPTAEPRSQSETSNRPGKALADLRIFAKRDLIP